MARGDFDFEAAGYALEDQEGVLAKFIPEHEDAAMEHVPDYEEEGNVAEYCPEHGEEGAMGHIPEYAATGEIPEHKGAMEYAPEYAEGSKS